MIATVPLELAYPSITVNPALFEPDRAPLRDAVQRLNGTVRTGTPAEPSAAPRRAEGGLRYTYRPHALDGADARPFMHPDCVQNRFRGRAWIDAGKPSVLPE